MISDAIFKKNFTPARAEIAEIIYFFSRRSPRTLRWTTKFPVR